MCLSAPCHPLHRVTKAAPPAPVSDTHPSAGGVMSCLAHAARPQQSVRDLHVPVPGHLLVLGDQSSFPVAVGATLNSKHNMSNVDSPYAIPVPISLSNRSSFLSSFSVRPPSCKRPVFMASWRWVGRGGSFRPHRGPSRGYLWWISHVSVMVVCAPSLPLCSGRYIHSGIPSGFPCGRSQPSPGQVNPSCFCVDSFIPCADALCFAQRVRMSG